MYIYLFVTKICGKIKNSDQGKKRFPLTSDKRVAEKMLADLVAKAERGQALMPEEGEASRPLEPLVVEFETTVGRKATKKQTRTVGDHVRRVLTGCKIVTLADLHANDLAARVEVFVWSLAGAEDGVGAATAAYIGKHARSFTRWLWRKWQLLDFDPLAGMDLPSQETEHHRRALSVEELALLVETADKSAKFFRYLTGPARAILYLVAVSTGYRSGELAKLTPTHFDLDADVPLVRMKGKHTKKKKPAEQPLPPGVIARLRPYLQGRPAADPIWPSSWPDRAADMLRADLLTAGIPFKVDDETALFHSLRHTSTTLLARSAPVKVTQELARHCTPVLTLGRYSHATMRENAEAVNNLPLPGSTMTARPFAGMTRADLETTAESLLTALVTLLVTPRVTPNLGMKGDSGRQTGTETTQGDAAH